MDEKTLLAISTVVGKSIEASLFTSMDQSGAMEQNVLSAVDQVWEGEPKLISAQDFKDRFYNDKWKSHGMTAFHPERLPAFWSDAASSNWILLGNKEGQAIAVVNGKIDPSHKDGRFKVVNLVELPMVRADISPVKAPSSPIGGPTLPKDCDPPKNGGKEAFPTISTDTETPLEGTALHYAAWALDCLNRKQYADAKHHLATALKRAGYYEKR